MQADLKDILILDIETVSIEKDWNSLSPAMQEHWNRKSKFLRNEDELAPDELFFDRGAIYAEFGKVIVIALGIFHEIGDGNYGLRVTSFQNHNENELLNQFKDFLESKFDARKLRLCAHNGKEFDYPYLCRRMLVNGISLPEALDVADKKPWEILHLDTMDMWKFGDRKSFTSLDLLTTIFGISSSKSEIDGSQVNKVYYEEESGLDRIAKYCRGDVIATSQLYLKLNNLPLVENSRITEVS